MSSTPSNPSDPQNSSGDGGDRNSVSTNQGGAVEPDEIGSNTILSVPSSQTNINIDKDKDKGAEEGADEDASTAAAPPSTIEGESQTISNSMTEGEFEGEEGSSFASGPEDPLAAKKAAYAQRKAQKAKEDEDKAKADALADLAEEEERDEEVEEEGKRGSIKPDLTILERHDSELTPKQIVEKDIVMYDLLLSNEELMEISDKKKVEDELEEDLVEVEIPIPEMEELPEITEEEEEVEEEEEMPEEEEVMDQPDNVDLDDPDNIVNMMMQAQELDDDGVNVLFLPDLGLDQDGEALASQDGIVGLTLSDETKRFLELEPDPQEWTSKWAWISFKRVKMHVYINEDKSEFFPYYEQIKNYPDFAMLLGLDLNQHTGHPFFLCITPEARNYVLNPPKKKKVFVDLKKKEEEAWDKLASIIPKKWKNLGSDREVIEENIKNTRPLLTVYAYRYAEFFGKEANFSDAKFKSGSECEYTSFDPKEPGKFPGVERMEVDKGIQVNPPKVSTETQTGFSFKRNKMCQQEVVEVAQEQAEKFISDPNTLTFLHKTRPHIVKALQQNEMLNIMADDYHNLRAAKGHEIEFNNESVLLQEYATYSDQRHSKGRSVSFMSFHPLLDEVVITSFAEDVTFDKRIEFHSKTLMEPNFVLLWDLKDPSKPQLMLDAPSDVFSLMVSPSDPNLICGGCENGQVVLWDMGRYYIELRNKIQDRKRKDSEGAQNTLGFLEKLKDSAEKYVCPLIPPAGLSNLDSSHKRVVTSVHWLPPHIELGKNGNLYDNLWGGRSAQFFSVAGDSSLRLWDIRAQKLGLDEFDMAPVTSVKQNPWHHLENNNWKYSFKYTLDDGINNNMFCTLISLSEGKIGDTLVADSESVVSVNSKSSMDNSSLSGSAHSSQAKVKDRDKKKASNLEKRGSAGSGGSEGGGGDVGSTSDHSTAVDVKSTSFISSGGTGGGSGKSVDGDMEAINAVAAVRRHGGATNTNNALTSFFAGTETGQIALVDWLRNKDGSINPDASGTRVCQCMYLQQIHDGAITSICRSPFHHDLILVVGGGTVSIWKETSSYPILATLGGENFPWCGCWSTTRPGVFFCGTREGFLQVWDLMDKSHAPVLTQQVTPGRVCSIATPKSLTNKKHFLAIGDSFGTLVVLLIPRYYTKPQPGENASIIELMSREQKRMNAWVTDAETREEKIKTINQEWRDSRVTKTEREINEHELKVEARLQMEYQEFLEFQAKLVGKLKRDEPELPTDDLDIDQELENLIAEAEKKELERLKREAAEAAMNEEGEEEEEGDED